MIVGLLGSMVMVVVAVVISVAFIAVGATVVRRAHAPAGYTLVGLGVFLLLTRCCAAASGPVLAMGMSAPVLHQQLFGVWWILESIIVGSLLVATAVMLAKAGKRDEGPTHF